jgi:hypothetical protein
LAPGAARKLPPQLKNCLRKGFARNSGTSDRFKSADEKRPRRGGANTTSACLSSIANLPATVGIANAVGAAAAARAGPYHNARRYHNAWCYIGTANAVKTPVPAGATATGDGNCQRGLCLWRDRHGLGGGCCIPSILESTFGQHVTFRLRLLHSPRSQMVHTPMPL